MTDIRHTVVPLTSVSVARMLLRRTFHPYGKEGPSFSVTLREDRDGATYLLSQRDPGRKLPIALFEGKCVLSPDLDETAAQVLDTLTFAPGDAEGIDFTDYTPPQLDFAIQHARALRQCVGERLAWNEAKRNPRMDLDLQYKKRAIGDLRHRFTSGVVDVAARTRKDAKSAFQEAIRNHLSALPSFAKNAQGAFFALFPKGSEWVIQPVDPSKSDWLGEAYSFAARSPEEAETELARVANKTESMRPKSSGKLKSTGPTIGVRA